MDITRAKNGFENLKELFWEANRAFMEKNYVLLDRDLSERCLCGALMCELNKQLEKNACNNYYAKPYPLSRTFLREREKQQFLPEPLLLSFY